MKRSFLFWPAAILVVLIGVGAAFGPRIAAAGIPDDFELDFRAFGYVEAVRDTRGGCEVDLAIFEWVNLSPGFDIAEIPRQNDRYTLIGERDSCQALTVAMAATGQHISFGAGRSRGRWYFLDRPSAAYGCGGLEIDWTPDAAG